MIVVTGGLGFIGLNLVNRLYNEGYNIIILDTQTLSLFEIKSWLTENVNKIDAIFHLGANTDTTEMNERIFIEYNFNPSMFIWQICTEFNIPLIYASSAATYGDGSRGFDDERPIDDLTPLNPYGLSKLAFDFFIENQEKQPPFFAGLKFFNVYGFGEHHKGKMASVVFHSYNQIKETGKIKLFKSHNSNYKNGEQLRDFIYVDDVVDVCIWMYKNRPVSGLYNVGTGKSRTFKDLANIVFKNLDKPKKISYINTPKKIRDKYQYFTEAKINKLRKAGYTANFHELEEGIEKYVKLLNNK